MEHRIKGKENSGTDLILFITAGVAVNAIFGILTYHFSLPLYLDTAGTIAVGCAGGLLPGVITALATNLVALSYNPFSVYYSVLNVLIGIAASEFYRRRKMKEAGGVLLFILTAAIIGGGLGGLIQWLLLGRPQFYALEETAKAIFPGEGAAYMGVFILLNIGLNFVDKGITTLAALAVLKVIPENEKRVIADSSWRQRPLTESEIEELKKRSKSGDKSLQTRMTLLLSLAAIALTLVMCLISLKLYFEKVKAEYTETAYNAARFAADIIDPEKVDQYLEKGESVEGYTETRDILYKIRTNATGVKYLYVVKIKPDGCYFIFDLETDDTPPYEPGERIDFEDAFTPYLPSLFKGEEIEPIVSDDYHGWLLTIYHPLKNSAGETVCYVGADVSMDYLSDYVRDYFLKTLLIFSGVFILVLSYGIWVSRSYLVFPIDSMAQSAENFANNSDDDKILDENVMKLRALDIRTGDEVEKLYRAICKMSQNTAEQIRSIRYYAKVNEKMQNGLIITMANMVENRDSDTGAHIQKTAAYVRIILNGLRRKGYYAEKLNDKYISDVEMSAPLHDVGKIHIPDAVLNKPGKLTDEEYEIMKTHTTAGKEILENAIGSLQGENYLKEARNMAAYHHERWDGKGYPEGLHGEVIPLSARVMAIADVFDAIASPRVYKPAFSFEKAVAIIEEGSGTQFDPKCVEVFLDSLPEVRKVLKKYQE